MVGLKYSSSSPTPALCNIIEAKAAPIIEYNKLIMLPLPINSSYEELEVIVAVESNEYDGDHRAETQLVHSSTPLLEIFKVNNYFNLSVERRRRTSEPNSLNSMSS